MDEVAKIRRAHSQPIFFDKVRESFVNDVNSGVIHKEKASNNMMLFAELLNILKIVDLQKKLFLSVA